MDMEPKALILAGGKSRRLGKDKVLLDFSGECLLTRTTQLASSVCHEVCVSGRDPMPLDANQDRPIGWIRDDIPGMGPIGGIATGLRLLKAPLLVLACDMPLLNREMLARLLEARARRPRHTVMTTFRQRETGFIEALVSIYEPEALPFLLKACERGMFKLSRAIPGDQRHHIPYGQEEATPFFNINYPADLAVLHRIKELEATWPDVALA